MILKLDIGISGDATELYMTDDSIGWGETDEPTKGDINIMRITIQDKAGTLIPTPVVFAHPAYDMVNGTITITPSDLGLGTDVIPDDVYIFTYYLESTTAPWGATKDGEFAISRTVEQNIHEELLVELNRAKAYNCEPDFETLKELRRRSNLVFGITGSEFFAESDNIKLLLNYLQILEK